MTVIEQEINLIADTLDPESCGYDPHLTKAERTALRARWRALIALRLDGLVAEAAVTERDDALFAKIAGCVSDLGALVDQPKNVCPVCEGEYSPELGCDCNI